MKMRSLVLSIVVGTIVLFVWQSISNAAIPWHTKTEKTLTDTSVAAARALRAQMPTNGVYFSRYGLLAAVNMTPDMQDQSKNMGPALARQLAIDLAVAWMLVLLALRTRDPRTAVGYAGVAAFAGLAGALVIQLSDWNWYGFSFPFACVNIIDTTISFWITGWVIGFMMLREKRKEGVSVPTGAGYGASGVGAGERVR